MRREPHPPPPRDEPELGHTRHAVLLRRAADNAAARTFLAWLRGDAARARIVRFGYGID